MVKMSTTLAVLVSKASVMMVVLVGAMGDTVAASSRGSGQPSRILISDGLAPTDASLGNGERIKLAERYLGEGSSASFGRAAALLRAVVRNDSGDVGDAAMRILVGMRKKIRREFSQVTDQAVADAHGSVGVALSLMGEDGLAIDVMIREAWLLNAPARIMLAIHYEQSVEGFRAYDPRILAFYEASAAEGVGRSMLQLGRILLYGWGVKPDIDRAVELLKSVEFPEAHMALADLELGRNNAPAALPHLIEAAKTAHPRALYNLAIMLQKRKMYDLAVGQFEMLLKYHPDHMGGRLELARMYAEGWGVDRDERKGFEMMKQFVDQTDGRVRAMADANIGIFYMEGRGVARSLPKARFHLQRAVAGGVGDVEKYLKMISEY